MFGHHGWRPLTVALLVSGAVFLPQGVAAAAPPDKLDSATCAQLSAEARSNRADCTPSPRAAANPFVGPQLLPRTDQGGDAQRNGSSVAGLRFTGSANTGFASSSPTSAPTVAPATAAPDARSAPTDTSPSGASTSSGATTGPTTNPTPTEPTPAATATAIPAPVVPNGTESSTTGPSPWDTTAPTSAGTPGSDTAGAGTTGTGSASRPESESSSSGRSDADDSGSDSGSDSDKSSKSSKSSESSDEAGSSSSSGSSSGGYSGSTSTGSSAGAASCPSGAGSGTTATGSGPSSATGSVSTAGVATVTPNDSDTRGAASVTDPTGGAVSTVTRATNQALAGTTGATSSVAGTVLDAATATASRAGTASLPGDVIDLGYWYLTLPTGTQGSPDTVENPSLEKFTNQFFKLNPNRDGVVFSANGDGVTTKNSHYPRSELREMNGSAKASWSNTSGTHTLDVCEAFTKLPGSKPEVVGAQIHDDKDDVMQIRLEGQKLMVQYNDGKSEALLDPNYQLGTPYNVRIVAANSKVDVLYNGAKKAELPLSGSGWYWKVGAYVQSNSSKGDGASSTGEVTVYSLKCVHQ
jgi:Alginate lyase